MLLNQLESRFPSQPDIYFYLALVTAFEGKLEEALQRFEYVLEIDPLHGPSWFEKSATLFRLRRYAEAYDAASEGLAIAPQNEYGIELAGTAAFLLGDYRDALRLWNQIHRPRLVRMDIVGDLDVRQRVAQEVGLNPGELLSARELDKADWRISHHTDLPIVRFEPVPAGNPQEYSLTVHVRAREGLGNWGDFLGSSLGQLAFQTVRFSYWDLLDQGINLRVPFRFNPRARLAGIEIDKPRLFHGSTYPTFSYHWRDEQWDLNDEPGLFRIKTHRIGLGIDVPVNLPRLSARLELSHRWREFSTTLGSPSTSNALVAQEAWRKIFGVRFQPEVLLHERYPSIGRHSSLFLEGDIGLARLSGEERRNVARMALSLHSEIGRKDEVGDITTLALDLHTGFASVDSPIEDYFQLGLGPDTDFPLRAHRVFVGGRKGRIPIVRKFGLANATLRQRLWRRGLFELGGIGFGDLARLGSGFQGQELRGWIVDSGLGVELGIPGGGGTRLTVAYARDWNGGRNAIFIGTTFPR